MSRRRPQIFENRIVRCRFILWAVLAYPIALPAGEIHDAVLAHDLVRVRQLLKASPKLVNERTEKGDTPLYIAAFLGQSPQMVPLLLQLGADPNPQPNLRHETPLSVARELNKRKTAELLLQAGAREDDISRAARIRYLTQKREMPELGARLTESPHLVNARDAYGQTPLNLAVSGQKPDPGLVQFLIARGADPNATNHYGGTPYSVAVDRGNSSMAALLLQHGAKETPVSRSAPLRLAALRDQLAEAEALVRQSPEMVNSHDDLRRTPLHFACAQAGLPLVELLLKHGADVHATDFADHTPLHGAAFSGKADIINALLARKADPNQRNRQRTTPLFHAALRGSLPAVEALLRAGADLKAADNLGETALHRAASGGHAEVLKLLLDRGADVNVRDKQGQSALHQAAQQGHAEAVRLLLARKADVTFKDVSGQTASGLAAKRNHEEVVQLLKSSPPKP
ncbi:MAG: ankyrin repeat domain-containing protein [Verrucomicrobia bacterium]|nr:ankyrin repeat domain-containing protein [Verrucomicrobiota bacterium]